MSRALNVVQFQNTSVSRKAVTIHLLNHKTQKTDKPIQLILRKQSRNCPVKALKAYFLLRGNVSGPLFLTSVNSPLTLSAFRDVFKSLLRFAKLSPSRYKLHSFRIGACTQAILSGTPENEVMRMGRWKSNAFKRYIRIPSVKTTTRGPKNKKRT